METGEGSKGNKPELHQRSGLKDSNFLHGDMNNPDLLLGQRSL